MDDLISRQAAIDALVKQTNLTWEHLKTIYPMLNVFEKLPSAERRGRWVYNANFAEPPFKCSACGKSQGRLSTYCPDCGAKMDEVTDGE